MGDVVKYCRVINGLQHQKGVGTKDEWRNSSQRLIIEILFEVHTHNGNVERGNRNVLGEHFIIQSTAGKEA